MGEGWPPPPPGLRASERALHSPVLAGTNFMELASLASSDSSVGFAIRGLVGCVWSGGRGGVERGLKRGTCRLSSLYAKLVRSNGLVL